MNVDRGLQMLTTELQRAKMDARERCDSGQDMIEIEGCRCSCRAAEGKDGYEGEV